MLPRERMKALGVCSLTDAELLAILLGTGICDNRSGSLGAENLAQELLRRFGHLSTIFTSAPTVLRQIRGIGEVKAARLVVTGELLRRGRRRSVEKPIQTAEDAAAIFSMLPDLDREELWIALLNQRNQCVDKRQVGAGGKRSCSISPPEIMRLALKYDGVRLIVAHNHPGGDPRPSEEDIRFTQAICRASRVVGITILDHLILGNDGSFFSFAREGFLGPRSNDHIRKPRSSRLQNLFAARVNAVSDDEMVHLALGKTAKGIGLGANNRLAVIERRVD